LWRYPIEDIIEYIHIHAWHLNTQLKVLPLCFSFHKSDVNWRER
jgi:hypothetical protein